jgi:hypothetical protein
MSTQSPSAHDSIHAVIAVWHENAKTFYVKRSERMPNYPLVWSLLSIQFDPIELPDQLDLSAVQPIMRRMSFERLNGAPLRVNRYLASATCSDNPMRRRVILHMYEVSFDERPDLNPNYYVAADWLDPDQYAERSRNSTCGLCMRMWSNYCVRHQLVDTPFAPELVEDSHETTA